MVSVYVTHAHTVPSVYASMTTIPYTIHIYSTYTYSEKAVYGHTVLWLPYSADIFQTVQFEEFCRSRQELRLLLLSASLAAKQLSAWKREPIVAVKPSTPCWVLLRSYGPAWYLTLPLEDLLHIDYYVKHVYGDWANKKHTCIHLLCPLFHEDYVVDNTFIELYGRVLEAPQTSSTCRILGPDDVARYPMLLPTSPPPSNVST